MEITEKPGCLPEYRPLDILIEENCYFFIEAVSVSCCST